MIEEGSTAQQKLEKLEDGSRSWRTAAQDARRRIQFLKDQISDMTVVQSPVVKADVIVIATAEQSASTVQAMLQKARELQKGLRQVQGKIIEAGSPMANA